MARRNAAVSRRYGWGVTCPASEGEGKEPGRSAGRLPELAPAMCLGRSRWPDRPSLFGYQVRSSPQAGGTIPRTIKWQPLGKACWPRGWIPYLPSPACWQFKPLTNSLDFQGETAHVTILPS